MEKTRRPFSGGRDTITTITTRNKENWDKAQDAYMKTLYNYEQIFMKGVDVVLEEIKKGKHVND